MSIELYFAFIAAVLVLVAIPGPNVALIVANSVAHGRRYGLVTVAGTSAAMLPQLGLAMLGMTALLSSVSEWLVWVRWLGVAYLLYLGIQAWCAPPVDLTSVSPEPRSAREIFLRGFLVSLTNPKTLLFYGAFFPQFVSSEGNLAAQFALLSITFLALVVAGDSCWAVAGAHFRRVLAVRGKLRNRITGGFFIAAALGLAAARKPA